MQQGSRAEEREKERSAKSKGESKSRHWRDMHNLIQAAPSFNGSDDVEFWLSELEHYLDRNEVDDEKTIRNVTIGTLEGSAREWFGSLRAQDCDKNCIESITNALLGRYGKTAMQKLRQFEAIKQKPNEKLQAYSDRLLKASYGLEKSNQELIYKFYKTINASSAVFDDVINLPCKSLLQAVEYVQQHSKGGDSGTTDKPTLRCSFCKAVGHTVKTCRKKNKP